MPDVHWGHGGIPVATTASPAPNPSFQLTDMRRIEMLSAGMSLTAAIVLGWGSSKETRACGTAARSAINDGCATRPPSTLTEPEGCFTFASRIMFRGWTIEQTRSIAARTETDIWVGNPAVRCSASVSPSIGRC